MRNHRWPMALVLTALVAGTASARAQDADAAMRECGGDAGVAPVAEEMARYGVK